MKTLLVLPRFEPNSNPPLGLAYIAAAMRNAKQDVEILDPTFEGREFAIQRIKKADYDIIGFSCFTMNVNLAIELAELAKKCNKKALTVLGGVHPTILPEETIKEKSVDAIALAEGEYTFVELHKAVENKKPLKGIKGIWFKKGKKVIKNPPRPLIENLDDLPLPARDLLPMDKYLNASIGRSAWAVKQPSTTITTTRGCPFQCTYCSSWLTFGRRARFRSPEKILEEIQQLVDNYKIKGLAFVDDTFTLRPKVVEAVCDGMIERNLNLEWICHTRVDTVSQALFNKMKKAGCKIVAMGIESGDQWVLDNILKKGIKLEQVEKAFNWARKAGLITDAYFMLGSPGETKEQMLNTIEFAKRSNIDYANFNVTRPMPKTEMHDLAEKYGKLEVNCWEDYDFLAKPIFIADDWTPEEAMALKKRAFREFYFNPRYILRQLFSIRGLDDLKRIFHGVQMVIKAT